MSYPDAAWERAMTVQEIILKALSGEIHWYRAADILGFSPRTLRRWRERYEKHGYVGLVDKRRHRPSVRRVAAAEIARLLQLYRERYHGFNVRHFHQIARREHGVTVSYSFLKHTLQGGRLGQEASGPRATSPAARATGVLRRAAASRWQRARVVHVGAGRPSVFDRRVRRCHEARPARGVLSERESAGGHDEPGGGLAHGRDPDGALDRQGALGVSYAEGSRGGRQGPAHASRPGAGAAGDRAHSGLLAAGAGPQ
jgi:transposase